jgi:hypothetical protein
MVWGAFCSHPRHVLSSSAERCFRVRFRAGRDIQMSERAREILAAEVDRRASRHVVSAPAVRKHIEAPSEKLDLSFAVWLSRQLRRERISQRELARRGGLDHSTISRILVGARTPSLITVQRIAQVVGFPPANVLLGRLHASSAPGDDWPARPQRRDGP